MAVTHSPSGMNASRPPARLQCPDTHQLARPGTSRCRTPSWDHSRRVQRPLSVCVGWRYSWEVGEKVVSQNSELPVQRSLIYKISFSYGVRSKPRYLHRITLVEETLRTATFPCYYNEPSLKD